jgi:SAM-dependent methyltransferase
VTAPYTPIAGNQYDLSDRVEQMEWIPRTKRNFRMQYRLAVHTLIPWLERLNALPQRASVCEIGCAEGGVLDAFVQHGAGFALGTDIMAPLLEEVSTPIAQALDLDVSFVHHDVIYDAIPEAWQERFDVVVLRDVIEHLDDAAVALRNIARIMRPGGVILITFPPYLSAYGGHQQLLGTALGILPWVHLLPRSIFFWMIDQGDSMNQEELRRLHRIRCSASQILHDAKNAGLSLVDERYFGLRPVFRWKYNKPIPTLELTPLKNLPLVRTLGMETALVFRNPA